MTSADSSSASQSGDRRYLRRLGVGVLVVLAGIAGLNLAVDPFSAYRGISLPDMAGFKKEIGSRTGKAELVRAFPGAALLVGSSRVEVGFDPENAAFGERRAVNLGLARTTMSEVREVLEYAFREGATERVFLFIDFHMFTSHAPERAADFAKSRLNPELAVVEYHLGNLLGWRATRASINALGKRFEGRTRYTERGFLAAFADKHPTRQRFRLAQSHFLGRRQLLSDASLVGARLEDFRAILRASSEAGAELVVALPPVHALHLETIRQAGLWPAFDAWKRALVAVVEEERPGVPVWDFTGYAGPAGEPLPEEEGDPDGMQWFWEASHFKSRLGDRVLARLLMDAPDEGFGVRLTTRNVEQQIARVEAERARWRVARREDAEWHERGVDASH